MRFQRVPARVIFCLAAAVSAAAAVDAVLERVSNGGLFGASTYTDQSGIDLIPALCSGLALFALLIAGVARRALSRRCYAPDWLRDCARVSEDCSLQELLPAIFALQIIVLWSMETLEQVAVRGHALGGLIWLGGPLLISLSLHAAGCVTFTWLLARVLRWSAQTIVEVATFIRRLFCALPPNRAARTSRAFQICASRYLEPILAGLHGRAPPYLSA